MWTLPLLLLLIACADYTEAGSAALAIATVGKAEITGTDVFYRVKTEQAYGNPTMTAEAALVSLINDAIEEEVAGMNGVTVTQEDIASFSRFVDETSRAPEILAKVKHAFGSDRAAYESLYLRPKIMNQRLRYFQSRDAGIHKPERTLIEKAYSLVAAGKTFQEAADACGLKAAASDIEDKQADVPDELRKYAADGEKPLKDPLISLLETLKDGELHTRIVEDDYSYRIVRRSGKKGNKYSVETITAVKRPFEEWLKKQSTVIDIAIVNAEMKQSVMNAYPGLWWLVD